jgi:cysteinyl-tRNA synthetase
VAWWGEDTRDSRVHTRKAKEFATTDLVRNKLTEAGVVLKDLPDGTG